MYGSEAKAHKVSKAPVRSTSHSQDIGKTQSSPTQPCCDGSAEANHDSKLANKAELQVGAPARQ
eukprot:11448500-Karenia_brevis.AAC.1